MGRLPLFILSLFAFSSSFPTPEPLSSTFGDFFKAAYDAKAVKKDQDAPQTHLLLDHKNLQNAVDETLKRDVDSDLLEDLMRSRIKSRADAIGKVWMQAGPNAENVYFTVARYMCPDWLTSYSLEFQTHQKEVDHADSRIVFWNKTVNYRLKQTTDAIQTWRVDGMHKRSTSTPNYSIPIYQSIVKDPAPKFAALRSMYAAVTKMRDFTRLHSRCSLLSDNNRDNQFMRSICPSDDYFDGERWFFVSEAPSQFDLRAVISSLLDGDLCRTNLLSDWEIDELRMRKFTERLLEAKATMRGNESVPMFTRKLDRFDVIMKRIRGGTLQEHLTERDRRQMAKNRIDDSETIDNAGYYEYMSWSLFWRIVYWPFYWKTNCV